MKKASFHGLDTAELTTKDREIQEQLFRIRFQMSLGQTEGQAKYRKLRKDRARVLTELRQREIQAQKEGK